MYPSWNRVADEIEAIASDRLLAASVEPDPRERALLAREVLQAACDGVVVQCDLLVIWGMACGAEQALRRLAIHAASGPPPDGHEVLRAVLGMPPQDSPVAHAGGPRLLPAP